MQDVTQFFNGAGDKKAYYVDVIYGYKDLDDGMQSQINISNLLTSVKSIMIQRMDKAYVGSLTDQLVRTFDKMPSSTGSSTSTPISINQTGATKDTNWKDPRNDIVTMKMIVADGSQDVTASKIYNALVTKLQDPSVNDNAKRKLEKIPKSHVLAHEFMRDIVLAVCSVRYTDMMDLVAVEARSTKFNAYLDVNAALNRVTELSSTKKEEILTSLHAACSTSLASMVKRKKQDEFLLSGYVPGNDAFEANGFKNLLRENMFDKLIIRGVTASDDQLIYIRRIFAEVYVNAFHPYVHFLYIAELLNYYKNVGDFVNMRVASLTKVVFARNLLQGLYNNAKDTTTFSSGGDGSKNTANVTQYWMGTLANYLNELAKVEFNSTMTLEDILADTHELSSRVVEQSLSVDQLKDLIKKSQLEIRSILSRFQQIHNQQRAARTKYGLLMTLLFIIIISSGVMISMNLYKDYLLYSLAGISALIVAVSLIMLIKTMVTNK